ncbi:hypothetical protein HMPREF3212_03668 [Citrobacter freundii]|nr:hypothetical protein AB07_3651 [Citrobacter freundii]KWZ88601.1 hypothetical protein HMPREF3212_03668 [Citrobacter freundii]
MTEESSAFFLINRGLHNSPESYVVVRVNTAMYADQLRSWSIFYMRRRFI